MDILCNAIVNKKAEIADARLKKRHLFERKIGEHFREEKLAITFLKVTINLTVHVSNVEYLMLRNDNCQQRDNFTSGN